MSEHETQAMAGTPDEQGSPLRQLMLKSKLTVKPVESYNPLKSERLMYSANAAKLVGDFKILHDEFASLERELEAASETVRSASEKQAGNARRMLDSLVGTPVEATDEDRKKRQTSLDSLLKEVREISGKVKKRTEAEEEAAELKKQQDQQAKVQIETDRTLAKTIGASFDDFKAAYGDKIEGRTVALIDGLRDAFLAVENGERPLTGPERTGATTLHQSERKALADRFDQHAGLEQRMKDAKTAVPPGASQKEQQDIENRRDAIAALLDKRPVQQAAVKGASDRIPQLEQAVQTATTDIAERKRLADIRAVRAGQIAGLLKTDAYAVPPGADEKEAQGLQAQHKTITDALAGGAPTVEGLALAEKTLLTLGPAVIQAQAAIALRQQQAAARQQRGQEITGLLQTEAYTSPKGAAGEDAKTFGTQRQAIADALATSPPSVDDLALAERTLTALGQGVAKARQDIGEAKASLQRPKDVTARLGSLDMDTLGTLLADDPAFKPARTFVDGLLKRPQNTMTAQEFNDASAHLATMEQRITETVDAYDAQRQGFETQLASLRYVDGEIAKVKEAGQKKAFATRLHTLRLEVEEGVKLDIAKLTVPAARAIEDALNNIRALAIQVADALTPPSAAAAAFDFRDRSTWTLVRKIRYDGNGTEKYVDGLSAPDKAMVARIEGLTLGDRHSTDLICTGKPMHQHTDTGSGGISFAYNHLGGLRVEPVIYDFASKRQGNTYEWKHGNDSAGPSGLPGSVKAKR